jgi:hypothetical protein
MDYPSTKTDVVVVPPIEDEEKEKRRFVVFYRRVPYQGMERFWIYVKRLGRVVNFEATNIPYLIRRLVYFYTISGSSLEDLESALKDSLKRVEDAKNELTMCD